MNADKGSVVVGSSAVRVCSKKEPASGASVLAQLQALVPRQVPQTIALGCGKADLVVVKGYTFDLSLLLAQTSF